MILRFWSNTILFFFFKFRISLFIKNTHQTDTMKTPEGEGHLGEFCIMCQWAIYRLTNSSKWVNWRFVANYRKGVKCQ